MNGARDELRCLAAQIHCKTPFGGVKSQIFAALRAANFCYDSTFQGFYSKTALRAIWNQHHHFSCEMGSVPFLGGPAPAGGKKSLLRAAEDHVFYGTRTEQPLTHQTSVSMATCSTSTEDAVTSLSLVCILLRI